MTEKVIFRGEVKGLVKRPKVTFRQASIEMGLLDTKASYPISVISNGKYGPSLAFIANLKGKEEETSQEYFVNLRITEEVFSQIVSELGLSLAGSKEGLYLAVDTIPESKGYQLTVKEEEGCRYVMPPGSSVYVLRRQYKQDEYDPEVGF